MNPDEGTGACREEGSEAAGSAPEGRCGYRLPGTSNRRFWAIATQVAQGRRHTLHRGSRAPTWPSDAASWHAVLTSVLALTASSGLARHGAALLLP